MDTLFIAEESVIPFKFWHHGQVVTGMHFRNEFFGQILMSPRVERECFFQQIERLSIHSSNIVITASRQRYIAWLNLKFLLSTSQFPQVGYPNDDLPDDVDLQAVSPSAVARLSMA